MSKIVVGHDGPSGSKRALERAAKLARPGDRVVVVSGAEPHAHTGITEGAHLDPSEVARRRADLGGSQVVLGRTRG